MIHVLQCLCGPARHAIMGVMYDDKTMSPEDAKDGLAALIEMMVAEHQINRRCEICDSAINEFWYDDGIMKEQEWVKARQIVKQGERDQTATRLAVQAARKAAKN